MEHFDQKIAASVNTDWIEFKCTDSQTVYRGIVIAVSPELVLLYNLEDGYSPDGFTLLTKRYISQYQIDDDPDCFSKKALQILKRYPKTGCSKLELPLSTLAEFLQQVKTKYPLIGVQKKSTGEHVMWVGKIARCTDRWLYLDEIDHEAKWTATHRHRLDAITQISFGNRYLKCLWTLQKHINQ